ncbi:30S ribosomal protein S9 [Candidatus Dependentiae bacterium]|nr:30S ribosomal protein S9 [Candidatus Dependentiae bacterium]
MEKTSSKTTNFHGIGRRKSSIARVWLKSGKGEVLINGKKYNEYFDTKLSRDKVIFPGKVVGKDKEFDISVNVVGGGKKGQAEAVRLGISRAFLSFDENLKSILRKHDLLTVDSRVKERKKYGQRGARRKFQFVKR